MKALTILSAAALMVLSFTSSASERGKETSKEEVSVHVKVPPMEFGSPDDIDDSEVEKLKSIYVVVPPAMIWGNVEDARFAELELQKAAEVRSIRMPEMVWGNPEDVNSAEIALLKIKWPEMVWGTPGDVSDLEQ